MRLRSAFPDSLPALSTRTLGLAALAIVAVVLTVPAQLAWMIAFDSTGLDVVVPEPLWLVVGPAATTSALALLVTLAWLGRRAAVRVAVAVLVAGGALAIVTMDAYGMCGPC